VTGDGFDAVSMRQIATEAAISEDHLFAMFGSLEDLLVAMLNREYRDVFAIIMDNVERDPHGGLVSHIYRYTITGVYERPLARALYLMDRDGLNTIMRATHGMAYIPEIGVRREFLDTMRELGMVRDDVDLEAISAVLSAVSAGAALTAPGSDLEEVTEGLVALLERGVDAEVVDTTPGKRAFIEYVLALEENEDKLLHDATDGPDPDVDDFE